MAWLLLCFSKGFRCFGLGCKGTTVSLRRDPIGSAASLVHRLSVAGLEVEVSSAENSSEVLSVRDPPKYHSWDDPDYRKWKEKEEEILRDIEPIVSLTKEILHSDRYMDGERSTVADEEAVVKKLLCHHPHTEDKIGCGLDSIMANSEAAYLENIYYKFKRVKLIVSCVLLSKFSTTCTCYEFTRMTKSFANVDRHPQFRHSRCLFVVRTDGGCIDFSYQKCLQAYFQDKYPYHAKRFIREHLKRGSG